MSDPNAVLTRGSEVWDRLVGDAGLDERRWDDDLTNDLRAALGLLDAELVSKGLDRLDIDADQFIRTFFTVVRPFVSMWEGLLRLFARAGADGDEHSLCIDYQPDITLVSDPITDVAASPVVVECKQYLRAANRSFANVLTDYATGRPNALVILVDHGPVDEDAVVPKVLDDVRTRAAVVSELCPGHAVAVDRFAQLVRTRLGLPTALREVATIALSGQPPPRDLDLRLDITERDGRTHRIDWQNPGDPVNPPWCCLERDVTSGDSPEVIRIYRWCDAEYAITVRRCSSDGRVADGNPQVTLMTEDLRHVFTADTDVDHWIVHAFERRASEADGPKA